MRVVSLVPSGTEIVCLLASGVEAGPRLVGRSHECDFPASVHELPALTGARVGGARIESAAEVDRVVREELSAGRSLYTLNERLLRELRPDVIVTQDVCEVCSIDVGTVRRAAGEIGARVVTLNPTTFDGVVDDVIRVGEELGLGAEGLRAAAGMRERMDAAAAHVNPYADGPPVAFLEWTDPLYVGGHWTPQLIERAGGRHPLNPTRVVDGAGAGAGAIGQTQRVAGKSVRVSDETLLEVRPEYVVVCPCGLGLEETRRQMRTLREKPWWSRLPAVRMGRVALVDGNQYFNRPGPRLVDAFEWLVGWLNGAPEVMPRGFVWEEAAGA